MKKILSAAIISLFIAACGGTKDPLDKQAKLDSLLKEQAKINEQVLTLKEQIRAESGDKSGIKLVRIDSPTLSPFRHYVEVQARVDGDQSVTIGPKIMGTVTSIPVNEGDRVSKGQVLATLDDQVIRQSLAEVETQYNFAKNLFEKQKNLWDQKIGSEVQYLTAKNNKESLEKRLASINEQLEMTRIKAPVDGTIDNVMIKVGQAVAPGMPAISVVNLSDLKVKGEVGESYVGKINKGDNVILYFPDLKKEIDTRVGFASKMINTLNRTFNVEVPLSGEKDGFSPNMVVVMKIVDYKNDSAMVLPVDMIHQSAEGNYVMTAIKKDGKLIAQRTPIETGMTHNGQTEVKSGLSINDQLITTGYRDLNVGQEIRIQ